MDKSELKKMNLGQLRFALTDHLKKLPIGHARDYIFWKFRKRAFNDLFIEEIVTFMLDTEAGIPLMVDSKKMDMSGQAKK